jgi:hypothetical protein
MIASAGAGDALPLERVHDLPRAAIATFSGGVVSPAVSASAKVA